MKIALTLIALLFASVVAMHWLHGPIHGASDNQAEHADNGISMFRRLHGDESVTEQLPDSDAVTFSLRQNDYDLCTDQFYVDINELTVEVFAEGAEQVVLADYQERIFNYVRTTESFQYGDRESWVEHIKDIPAQLIDIIEDDPAVVESCANFSVALVGPP